ncbi:MAG TPA: aminotransferase class I/II-fold pyridoxal phosphate-dependent enzyme [Thermoanaerobaculia bacterium]|nr:aminotransferase class I/II-fold pyridoxal phosphate-dependent enzyme [Thermoanaerobaculia bacterium]
MKASDKLNEEIERECPVAGKLLSVLGRRVVFPPGIPEQAGQAKGKRFNATIGQILADDGHAAILPAMGALARGLPEEARDAAYLYSPVQGLEALRRAWRERQRREIDPSLPSSLPLVTVGLTHALSLLADLFAGEERAVAVPSPFWGNYRQIFAVRTGAQMLTSAAYRDGRFNPLAIAAALEALPAGKPAIALVNVPSNPGGYSPMDGERQELIASLRAIAEERPLLVVCDDAYAGLVYVEGVESRSLFWDLIGAHPNLLPVKVDGATKELSFFGGRVGFLTFPFAPGSIAAEALESKVKCLVRATVGSPVGASQSVVLQALRDGGVDGQIAELRDSLAERHRVLEQALADVDPALLRALPSNSGCFTLLELPDELGLDAEETRLDLLEHFDTGLVAIPPRFLRVAFCSVAAADIPELVHRIEQSLRARRGGE